MAIVGPSGSGKSTVVSLLLRYYDANAGEVSVESEDIKSWNLRSLRSHLGLVGQEPVLFDMSIEENIRFGRESASFDDIVNAARLSNIHTFIENLPEKYQTRVGEKGAQLSGGQRQVRVVSYFQRVIK